MLESEKRGCVLPPGYLQLQHHPQLQQGLMHGAGSAHLAGGYPSYCYSGTAVQAGGGFYQTAGVEERAARCASSPTVDGSASAGYGSCAAASSPPTPPVTPGNRHQLPPHHRHQHPPSQQQQHLGTGHVTASASPSGIQRRKLPGK